MPSGCTEAARRASPVNSFPALLRRAPSPRGEGCHLWVAAPPRCEAQMTVAAMFCEERGGAHPGRRVQPRCTPRTVELEVEEVIGRGQVPKPYGVRALPDHISKVLKN